MTTKPKPPRDLLKEHEGERLHEAVEGLLRHALGVAALRAQAGLGLARAASAPQIPAQGGGQKAQTPCCAPRLGFGREGAGCCWVLIAFGFKAAPLPPRADRASEMNLFTLCSKSSLSPSPCPPKTQLRGTGRSPRTRCFPQAPGTRCSPAPLPGRSRISRTIPCPSRPRRCTAPQTWPSPPGPDPP